MTGTITYRSATVRDVDGIFRLVSAMAQSGRMLRRSKYRIVTTLANFIVAEVTEMAEAAESKVPGGRAAGDAEARDGKDPSGEAPRGQLVGCGAFLPLWTDSAEIVALAVDERFRGMGIGKGLVRELLERAGRLGFPEVITLTYEVEFFAGLGFTIQPKDSFPRKLWRECLECPRLEECDETAMSIRLD